jgi:hypothetical protein
MRKMAALNGHRSPNVRPQSPLYWAASILSFHLCVRDRQTAPMDSPCFELQKKISTETGPLCGRLRYTGFAFHYKSHVWPRLVWHPTATEPWNHVFKNVRVLSFIMEPGPYTPIVFPSLHLSECNYCCRLTTTAMTLAIRCLWPAMDVFQLKLRWLDVQLCLVSVRWCHYFQCSMWFMVKIPQQYLFN